MKIFSYLSERPGSGLTDEGLENGTHGNMDRISTQFGQFHRKRNMKFHPIFLLLMTLLLICRFGWAEDGLQRKIKAEVGQAFAELQAIDTPENNRCWDPVLWNENGFGKVVFKNVPLSEIQSDVPITHEVRFTAIMFRIAGWDETKIQAAFQRAAEVYTQCGIRVLPPKLVIADSPEGQVLNLTQVKDIAKLTPANLPKPWIYFVSQPLGVDEKVENAYAFTKDVGLINSHYDTIWMGSFTNTSRYKSERDPSYSPLAHEMAHVLGNYQHFPGPEKNILNSDPVGLANDHIRPEQCAEFKKHEAVRPISK